MPCDIKNMTYGNTMVGIPPKLCTYVTGDDALTVATEVGYFDQAAVKHYDFIFVQASDASFICRVSNDVETGKTVSAIDDFPTPP